MYCVYVCLHMCYFSRRHHILPAEGAFHLESTQLNLEFTYDIFMSAAILITRRESIMKTEGAIELLSYINGYVCLYLYY